MVGVLLFGLFNIATSNIALGDTHEEVQTAEAVKDPVDYIILQLLSQTAPIVTAVMGLGFDFLRRRGIQISAESEKYFTSSISSMVSRQSKWIYEEMRDNKQHWDDIDKNDPKVTEIRVFPKSLGKKARDNVIEHFTKMLESDELTGHAKKILKKNLPELVEIAVTDNNKKLSVASKGLIRDLTPLAIDALLLNVDKQDVMKNEEKTKKLVENAIDVIKKNFDFEEIVFHDNFADLFVKATLKEKLEKYNK